MTSNNPYTTLEAVIGGYCQRFYGLLGARIVVRFEADVDATTEETRKKIISNDLMCKMKFLYAKPFSLFPH